MSSRPTFLDRARASQKRIGPECTVSLALADMEPGYRAEVEATLADPKVHSTTIARLLVQDGISISAGTIGRHRGGECMCGRVAA